MDIVLKRTCVTFRVKDRGIKHHKLGGIRHRGIRICMMISASTRQRDRADILPTWLFSFLNGQYCTKTLETAGFRKLAVGKLKDLDTSNQFTGNLQEMLPSKIEQNLWVEEFKTGPMSKLL